MNKQIQARVWSRTFVLGWAALATLLALNSARADIDPKFYAVEASAEAQNSPPQIVLHWPGDPNATGYEVYRKSPLSGSWGNLTSVARNSTGYTDSSVSAGAAYEYQIVKNSSTGVRAYSYLLAGIAAPMVENRGKIILIVDNTYSPALASELKRLQEDLTGDGWIVIRHDVSRHDSPQNIKRVIQADYAADRANVRTVFLFGHVPVPYSGNFNPDSHPDHVGAWPADVYYGDMDGSWTDSSVNNTSAARAWNWNVAGDGKFDQSNLPSDVELEVGRVDLSNMTNFANKSWSRSEFDLLRQYLDKDHRFRHGQMSVERRGIICDNFGEKDGQAFAAAGWRNFASFFSADKITAVSGWNYFPSVTSGSYLWSYACGGGAFYTCDGVGSADDFATKDIQTVFTMFLGSYFGDWDNESNFLRSPLGSTSYALASIWSGRPHWFLHHMALGETIGFSTRLSQNNGDGSGLYRQQNPGSRQVHVALMGDPTLRLHPVVPPANVQAGSSSGNVQLSWTPSTDSAVTGYFVYRANAAAGPFTRISGTTPVSGTAFTDANPVANSVYMVRAVKLETSGSGSYWNPSQGIFQSIGRISAAGPSLTTTRLANGDLVLHLNGPAGTVYSLQSSDDLLRWKGVQTVTFLGQALDIEQAAQPGSNQQFYRLIPAL